MISAFVGFEDEVLGNDDANRPAWTDGDSRLDIEIAFHKALSVLAGARLRRLAERQLRSDTEQCCHGNALDQDILAYFTRPTRSVNHRAIAEIRTGAKHKALKVASEDELDAFLSMWPDVVPQTGLSLRGDELLIKAREAMIAAVHIFNSAGLHFRAELFIVTAVIAWTYLLHAFLRREGVDYRYYRTVKGVRTVEKTKNDADKYWELGKCLRSNRCPVARGVKQNLEFLLTLRHEIEHRSTTRIDEASISFSSLRLQGRERRTRFPLLNVTY